MLACVKILNILFRNATNYIDFSRMARFPARQTVVMPIVTIIFSEIGVFHIDHRFGCRTS